jgi:hypothetical protein
VIGSPLSPEADGAVPQQAERPDDTCLAASPYFSRTVSVIVFSAEGAPPQQEAPPAGNILAISP